MPSRHFFRPLQLLRVRALCLSSQPAQLCHLRRLRQ
jgi:hypothetical protein